MVIGIDHLHIHNGKFAPYVEVCGPQGPIFEYKGAVFFFLSNQGNYLALVWYGDAFIIHTSTMVNIPHMLNYACPRSLYLKLKGLLCLSNQGIHLALVWDGDW